MKKSVPVFERIILALHVAVIVKILVIEVVVILIVVVAQNLMLSGCFCVHCCRTYIECGSTAFSWVLRLPKSMYLQDNTLALWLFATMASTKENMHTR